MRRAPLLLLLAVAACDSAEDAPSLSGLYVFSAVDTQFSPPVTTTLALALATSGGAFTLGPGSYYRLQGDSQSQAAVTGTGTYSPPTITVSLDAIDLGQGVLLDAATFTGTVSADGATLTLTGDGQTLTLRRQ